eukprot:TRINITY_DN1432_c0_g1_i4.p1 TRINITY_DN1432_c0_g1~~TRINITY_DN1432_c0_g1_i4.p1  ORF type:complete len:326 (+),score=67.87 TRINITY_DN1432_c0_g1_i4:681-1658(+)
MEEKFWKETEKDAPIYGADMEGSLFLCDDDCWNLKTLKRGSVLENIENMPGITEPYLYFGMWGARFAWHTEDMDLYSINYIHKGSGKLWYGIPCTDGEKFEKVVDEFLPNYEKCENFLRHKTTLISPFALQKMDPSISICTTVQEEGQFMITFPYAYHQGFNLGYNVAESVNFALDDWLSHGKEAVLCTCTPLPVYINMNRLIATIEIKKENKELTEDVIHHRVLELAEESFRSERLMKARSNHERVVRNIIKRGENGFSFLSSESDTEDDYIPVEEEMKSQKNSKRGRVNDDLSSKPKKKRKIETDLKRISSPRRCKRNVNYTE